MSVSSYAGNTVSVTAAESLLDAEGCVVGTAIEAALLVDDQDTCPIGIVMKGCASGDQALVQIDGICEVKCDEAISLGEIVQVKSSAANGVVVGTAVGSVGDAKWVIGRCIRASAAQNEYALVALSFYNNELA